MRFIDLHEVNIDNIFFKPQIANVINAKKFMKP